VGLEAEPAADSDDGEVPLEDEPVDDRAIDGEPSSDLVDVEERGGTVDVHAPVYRSAIARCARSVTTDASDRLRRFVMIELTTPQDFDDTVDPRSLEWEDRLVDWLDATADPTFTREALAAAAGISVRELADASGLSRFQVYRRLRRPPRIAPVCDGCGQPLPPEGTRRRRYCSPACKMRSARQRWRHDGKTRRLNANGPRGERAESG
jgi:hypothetical protein